MGDCINQNEDFQSSRHHHLRLSHHHHRYRHHLRRRHHLLRCHCHLPHFHPLHYCPLFLLLPHNRIPRFHSFHYDPQNYTQMLLSVIHLQVSNICRRGKQFHPESK